MFVYCMVANVLPLSVNQTDAPIETAKGTKTCHSDTFNLNNYSMKKFKRIGRTGGDEITPYEVTFDEPYTLKRFLDELGQNEWGYISINQKTFHIRLEYKKGEIIDDGGIPIEYLPLDYEISTCVANGGWSRMDYDVILMNTKL